MTARHFHSRMQVIAFACAYGFSSLASAGDPTDARLQAPSAHAQEQAVEKVRNIFRRDYAAVVRGASRSDIARQLLEQAKATTNSSDRWALLTESLRFATDAGDTDLALSAVEVIGRDYQIDQPQLMADTLGRLAMKIPASAADGFSRKCLAFVRDAQAGNDNAGVIQKVLGLAATGARKTDNVDLQAEVARVVQREKERQRTARDLEASRARVAAAPDDAELNLQLGRILCLKCGRWREGIEFVVKGGETDLAALARAEAEGVVASGKREALADDWWSWAESQKSPWKQLGLARAAIHYAAVLNDRDGLERARIENRLADAMESGGGSGERCFLAETKELAVSGAANGFTKNGTFNGVAFTCREKEYPKSVFVHPPDSGTATITFRLPPGARRLRGAAGIFSLPTAPPMQQPGSPITFRVIVDGEPAWVSPALVKRDQLVLFDVDVRGGRILELQTSSAGSANTGWGAWLDPVLLK